MKTFPSIPSAPKSRFPTSVSPKSALLPALLFTLFLIMLLQPDVVFQGAAKGLLLWYKTVFPTLFPFLFVCNLLVQTNAVHCLACLAPGILCRFFGVPKNGMLAILTGFLCGYPMGAKVMADLCRTGKITRQEGSYLLSFCNNTSPAFILSYVIHRYVREPRLLAPTCLILFFSPVMLSFFFRKIYARQRVLTQNPLSAPIQGSARPLPQALDDSLSNAMETIVKIGGYIILFCVLTELLGLLPLRASWARAFLFPNLEITNGIALIWGMKLPFSIRYPLCIFCTAFGGWCAVLQTISVIQGTDIPIFPYIMEKLATASAASFFAYLYLQFYF